jgi:2-polyprenyl-6-methoxyphenol hydroxylase-like FAD-dependent oxidoreductase
MTSYGTLLGPYHHDWLQRQLVRPFYFTDNERLPQYATEAVLRARAAELPAVTTLFGWGAESVTQDARGVTAAERSGGTERRNGAAERSGGGRRMISARYVVGCDGARSTVREQAGITQTRSDHERLMVKRPAGAPRGRSIEARRAAEACAWRRSRGARGLWRSAHPGAARPFRRLDWRGRRSRVGPRARATGQG